MKIKPRKQEHPIKNTCPIALRKKLLLAWTRFKKAKRSESLSNSKIERYRFRSESHFLKSFNIIR